MFTICHISSDVIGGAARAAFRLHKAINFGGEMLSRMVVRSKTSDDWRVTSPIGKFGRAIPNLGVLLDGLPMRLQSANSPIPRSASWVSALTAKTINNIDADIIHIHWACAGFLSVEQMALITKPLVWTLHDMWGFCGSEHLAPDSPDARWRAGYEKSNQDPLHRGIDIDRWVWLRKKKAWRRPMHIITPSRWLADCARSSSLMRDWHINVIPNILDVSVYKPIDKSLAREALCLPHDKKLVLFGAIGGTRSPHKGWDLLQPALLQVAERLPNVNGIIFGQGEPQLPPSLGMHLHWMGHLQDDATLALLYSAADVMVVPSKQEAFGQTASEAQACGCPVVAFNATGLKDIVGHCATGFLATPFSSDDLANGIEWVLSDDDRHAFLSINARARAVKLWSDCVLIPQYSKYYHDLLDTTRG